MADEIWQYRTGGNVTIFDKDHDTAEADHEPVLAAKHTVSLQFLSAAGDNQATFGARTEFEISQPSPKGWSCTKPYKGYG